MEDEVSNIYYIIIITTDILERCTHLKLNLLQ